MLHARIDVAQILDKFQVGCEITEFAAGEDPVVWTQRPVIFTVEGPALSGDALSTVIAAIHLWSEMTIPE